MNTLQKGPTLCNPEALNTVAELRAELNRANEKLLFAADQAHSFAVRHDIVLEWVAVIAAHHEEGNTEQVKRCLDNVIANKNKQQQMQH